MAPPHARLSRVVAAALAVVAAAATPAAPRDAVIGRALQASALSVCTDAASPWRSTVAAGDKHTCVVTTAGGIACWGGNYFGQSTAPASVATSGQVSVAAKGYHNCALSGGGGVTCWGYNDFGQTVAPALVATSSQAVVAGESHTCTLSLAGGVMCWGNNGFNQTAVPASVTTSGQVAVVAGWYHTCALSAAGGLTCWGATWNNINFGQTIVPANVAVGDQVAVAAGHLHTCALSAAGGVACWGRNDYGQTAVPAAAATSGQVAVTAGGDHTCALSGAGGVTCWGKNNFGQATVPASVATSGQVAVVAGGEHTCALSAAGGLVCWGRGSEGQTTVPASLATGGVARPCRRAVRSATATQTPSAPATATATPTPTATYIPETITTFAGIGVAWFGGDGGPAIAAGLSAVYALAVDNNGDVLVADYANHRIRRVAAGTGVITSVAGNGGNGFSGDGGAATNAGLAYPRGLAIDNSGNFFISDSTHRIRRVASDTSIINTVVGTGSPGFSGDGGAATSAYLSSPIGLAMDHSGHLFIADSTNHRIRRFAASTGIVATVAGNGVAGFSGDGGPATSASLNYPYAIDVDGSGNVFIADGSNQRIRRVAVGTGVIMTVAGNGVSGFSGDGGPPLAQGFSIHWDWW